MAKGKFTRVTIVSNAIRFVLFSWCLAIKWLRSWNAECTAQVVLPFNCISFQVNHSRCQRKNSYLCRSFDSLICPLGTTQVQGDISSTLWYVWACACACACACVCVCLCVCLWCKISQRQYVQWRTTGTQRHWKAPLRRVQLPQLRAQSLVPLAQPLRGAMYWRTGESRTTRAYSDDWL